MSTSPSVMPGRAQTPASAASFVDAAVDLWWIGIPAALRRYSMQLATAWQDGLYLTAWPDKALLLSLGALLVGFLEGATHWSVATVGDGAVGPGVPVVAFAQIVPLILLAAAVGALSANAGFLLVLGYALGDFLIAGPRIPWEGGLIGQLVYLRVPQLLSYVTFFALAVTPTLTTQFLLVRAAVPTSALPGVRRSLSASPIARIGLTVVLAIAQGVFVYAWTLSAPMFTRILWYWPGVVPPVIVPFYVSVVDPWVPAAAVVATLARGGLVGFAYRDSRVGARATSLQRALQQADGRPGLTRRLPPPASTILAAGLLALLLSGFFASAFETFVAFVFIAAILVMGRSILSPEGPWGTWTRLVTRVPAAPRLVAGILLTYLLTGFVLSQPGQSARESIHLPGDFLAEVISLALSLIVMMALLPATRSSGGPVTDSGGKENQG